MPSPCIGYLCTLKILEHLQVYFRAVLYLFGCGSWVYSGSNSRDVGLTQDRQSGQLKLRHSGGGGAKSGPMPTRVLTLSPIIDGLDS